MRSGLVLVKLSIFSVKNQRAELAESSLAREALLRRETVHRLP